MRRYPDLVRYVVIFAGGGFFFAWDLVKNGGEHTADLLWRIHQFANWLV